MTTLRPVGDPDGRWCDTVACSAWDDASGLFLLVRLARLPDEPAATAAVLVWVGARPVYAYGHGVDEVPEDALEVAGLRVDGGAGGGRGDGGVHLTDGDNALELRLEPCTAPVAYARLPRVVAWGHEEQTCRVTGTVDVAGHRLAVDGMGQRSRTWGIRDPDAVADAGGWWTATGFLGPAGRPLGAPAAERAFHVWSVGRDGPVDGYVHDHGTTRRVVGVERTDDHRSLEVRVELDHGTSCTFRGTTHGADVPVRPAGAPPSSTTVLHQQLVRWECDDAGGALDGYGIVEVLERP